MTFILSECLGRLELVTSVLQTEGLFCLYKQLMDVEFWSRREASASHVLNHQLQHGGFTEA